jgi:hypothetical protein
MAPPLAEVRAFLMNWKPFASLPADGPIRRDILMLLEGDRPEDRKEILQRVNPLYKLQRTYAELGILRDLETGKAETFAKLISLSVADFAKAIAEGQQKTFLTLVLEGFEFDRAVIAPNQAALRQFLVHFWSLRAGAPAIKYGAYPNNLLFSAGGKTHDELAREFKEKGFGSGQPAGGGFIIRIGPLEFAYDTYSAAVKSGDQRQYVGDSIRRSIRITGGDDAKVKIGYKERVV